MTRAMILLSLHVTAAYQPAQKGNEEEEDDNIPAHTIFGRSLELLIHCNFALQPVQQLQHRPVRNRNAVIGFQKEMRHLHICMRMRRN